MPVHAYRLRLHIDGVHPTEKLFDEIAMRALDARPILRVIQRLQQETAEEQFVSKGAASGNPWEPDLPETAERKEKEGDDPRTEIKTGELARSLLGSSDTTIRRLTSKSTTYGTRLFYSVYQGRKRTLLMLTTKDAQDWSERMSNWLLLGHGGI